MRASRDGRARRKLRLLPPAWHTNPPQQQTHTAERANLRHGRRRTCQHADSRAELAAASARRTQPEPASECARRMQSATQSAERAEALVIEYREVFAWNDRDFDGRLTTAEFGDAVRALGHAPTELQLSALQKTVDRIYPAGARGGARLPAAPLARARATCRHPAALARSHRRRASRARAAASISSLCSPLSFSLAARALCRPHLCGLCQGAWDDRGAQGDARLCGGARRAERAGRL